jgi:stalled ribosome rescue protein Dom34
MDGTDRIASKTGSDDMKKAAGIWIDHRQAVIVAITASGEEMTEISSSVEKHPGHDPTIAVPTGHHEDRKVKATDSQQREFSVHLDRYYDEVVAAVRDADAILVFGPGEAKGELRKRLEHAKLGAMVAAVETTDKLSDHQIAAKVREYFRDTKFRDAA